MDKDLKFIKKHYGEKMAHLCRKLFPQILESEGLLSTILVGKFAQNRYLADDILSSGISKVQEFRDYIFSFVVEAEQEKPKKASATKSAVELFDEAGYILYPECKTEADVQAFKKFYKSSEALCTFDGGRLNTNRVWFAVKKNINDIKRSDFISPQRQDEYGTSVISIQFTMGTKAHLSIKNRYNHTVSNPDNTFNSNLDNIKEGLTEAFTRDYGINNYAGAAGEFELSSYVYAKGKYYHYNEEVGGIYYCDNNVVIENFQPKRLDDSVILADGYVFDKALKKVYAFDKNVKDSFIESLGEVKNINFAGSVITLSVEGGEDILITLNKHRSILKVVNKNVSKVGDNFMRECKNLESVDMSNLTICGNNFLSKAKKLKNVELSSLEYCGDDFLLWAEDLESLSLPVLNGCGNYFLCHNQKMSKLDLPRLEECGYDFLLWNQNLRELNMPALTTCGGSFLAKNKVLNKANFPSLCECSSSFLLANAELMELSLPALCGCTDAFMEKNINLKSFSAPKLKVVGHNFFLNNKGLEEIYLPSLESCGRGFLRENYRISKIDLPSLKKVGGWFMVHNQAATTLYFPSLSECGNYFMCNSMNIKEAYMPALVSSGNYFLFKAGTLQKSNFSSLNKTGEWFLGQECQKQEECEE